MIKFDKTNIFIQVETEPALKLRSVCDNDLEKLRHWKNDQKQYFFYQQEISSHQQQLWFDGFKKRNNDLMFMTIYNDIEFGCMGIRWKTNFWDVYNIILGNQEYGKHGYMGKCFEAMIQFAQSIKPANVTLEVLKYNPAVKWYQKHGFGIISENENSFTLKLQSNLLKNFK